MDVVKKDALAILKEVKYCRVPMYTQLGKLFIVRKFGYVGYINNGYYLIAKGKREIQFRNFAKGYGIMALNSLLEHHFPTINTIEENLQKLIEIFGIYVVYCLIEATRLITAEKNDREDHWKSSYFGNETNFDRQEKFSERKLVNSWIMHIFNPINILNLFLVSISNSSGDDKKEYG